MTTKFGSAGAVALVVICIVVAAVLAAQRFGEAAYRVGESMEELAGVEYATAARTLVLSVHSTCGYCTASMPFYREILRQRAVRSASGALQVIAVSREDRTVADDYLREHGVHPDEVVTATLRSSATPTLVLVDGSAEILAAWRGQLSPDREDEVLGALFGPGT